jgi:hypothetical protein
MKRTRRRPAIAVTTGAKGVVARAGARLLCDLADPLDAVSPQYRSVKEPGRRGQWPSEGRSVVARTGAECVSRAT